MVELAQQNNDIYAVTAAMIEGTGYGKFAQNYPDRLVDVGIAEGHAVTMSAGLALSGKKALRSNIFDFLAESIRQCLARRMSQ